MKIDAGPELDSMAPDPTKRPVPIHPPRAMSWTCRDLRARLVVCVFWASWSSKEALWVDERLSSLTTDSRYSVFSTLTCLSMLIESRKWCGMAYIFVRAGSKLDFVEKSLKLICGSLFSEKSKPHHMNRTWNALQTVSNASISDTALCLRLSKQKTNVFRDLRKSTHYQIFV